MSVTAHALTDNDAIIRLCAEHERTLRFNKFNSEVAWEVGTAIRDTFLSKYDSAYSQGMAGAVVNIEMFGGQTLFSCAIGSAPVVGPDNWLWVRAKTNVVRRFGVSSLRKGREIAAKGQTPEGKGLNFPEYACHGGGFPIWLRSNEVGPVGVIVVSGLPQLEDHQLIIDALVSHFQ